MKPIPINDKIIRITDILEQIEGLNKMINLHKSELGNPSMLSQYEAMKNEFVQELNILLKEFQLNLKVA